MALPNSGPIGISDLVAEFGGTADPKLSDYYKGGKYVSSYAIAPNVPTSGKLSLSNFYGAAALDSTWLTPPNVEYSAAPGLIQVPADWQYQTVRAEINTETIIIKTPPTTGITDAANVHVLAADIKLTPEFAYDPAGSLHFVVGSRHTGREYLAQGDNKCGAIIGGGVFSPGYYGIEGVELGDYAGPNNNTFPWVWSNTIIPDAWWRVVVITQYASWGSSIKALLFNATGDKVVDTNFYSILPDSTVFGTATRDNYSIISIVSSGPPTASFTFKNVRSYWSETPSGIPSKP